VATSEQIRLLLVEDVAQVSQYVRNLLQHQKQVRLLDTVTDGRAVMEHIRELRPDALMVDALLQGKVNGLDVAEQVRHAGLRIPIIIVTVPQKPVKVGEGMGIVEVLSMPFSGYELMNALTHSSATGLGPTAMRSFVVYSGKGGVGDHHRLQPRCLVRPAARCARRAHRR
jgi:DNA-binding NarL/FixJ family response regulator